MRMLPQKTARPESRSTPRITALPLVARAAWCKLLVRSKCWLPEAKHAAWSLATAPSPASTASETDLQSEPPKAPVSEVTDALAPTKKRRWEREGAEEEGARIEEYCKSAPSPTKASVESTWGNERRFSSSTATEAPAPIEKSVKKAARAPGAV